MLPDGIKSKTSGVLYALVDGKQEWIKIGSLANTETISQKECLQTDGVLYALDKDKKEWIKIGNGNLENT